MYKLYWCPFTASLAPMAVLEELGVEYEAVLIETSRGQHRSPDYLAINPCGLVPAMTLPDGRTIFEAAAMVIYLCDLHPEADLAPAPDDPLRPAYLQWMLYLADTPQPNYRRLYYPERFASDSESVREKGVEALLNDWRIVEEAMEDKDWLLGNRFSACDIYMLMLATWFDMPEDLYGRYPNIARCARKTAARPATAQAVVRHQRA